MARPNFDQLIGRLSDGQAEVRADAAYKLSDYHDPRAIDALLPLLRDPIPHVRASAAYALYHLDARHIGEDILPLLSDPAVEVRLKAILAIGQCPEPRAISRLLALLEDEDDTVRDFARQYGFEGVGALAVPALIERLRDHRNFVRAGAARALALMSRERLAGTPADWARARFPYALSDELLLQVLQALTDALDDADAQVRYQAIQALSVHGDPRTVPALVNALMADEENRSLIASCLDQCNAGPHLARSLADTDPAVRAWAATGMGYYGEQAFVPLLEAALHDEDATVRQQILWALRYLDVHIHGTLVGLDDHTIWSFLREGGDVVALRRRIAPDQRPWFDQVTTALMTRFQALGAEVQTTVASILAHGLDPQDRAQRREIAAAIRREVPPDLVPSVFCAVDNKPYGHLLWGLVRPSRGNSTTMDRMYADEDS
jgi:HEAT repeat protein